MSQANYIELNLDSSHVYSFSIDEFSGDTSFYESSEAFSYDGNDTLIQNRLDSSRCTFSYTANTKVTFTEELDTYGNWIPNYIKTNTYVNGYLVLAYKESYSNGSYTPSSQDIYILDSVGQILVRESNFWYDSAWVAIRKYEIEYTPSGNYASAAHYMNLFGDSLVFQGYGEYKYDVNDQLQLITEFTDTTASKIKKLTHQIYGDDDLVDSVLTCSMDSNGVCINSYLTRYVYGVDDKQDSVLRCSFDTSGACIYTTLISYNDDDTAVHIESNYAFVDGAWVKDRIQLTYKGPGIYSDEPDSVIIINYDEENPEGVLYSKETMAYTDLGGGLVYSLAVRWTYNGYNTSLTKTETQKWYHVFGTIGIVEVNPAHDLGILFPNPTQGFITIDLNDISSGGVSVADIHGRLVKTFEYKNRRILRLNIEGNLGVYFVVLTSNGQRKSFKVIKE